MKRYYFKKFFLAGASLCILFAAAGCTHTAVSQFKPTFINEKTVVNEYGHGIERVEMLNSDEGYNIISTELAKNGITTEKTDREVKEIQLPLPGSKNAVDKTGNTEPVKFGMVLPLKSGNAYIKFITSEDVYNLINAQHINTPLSVANAEEAVDVLYAQLEKANFTKTDNAAIFYDPFGANKKAEEEDLRAQVKEFVQWMKEKGIQ